MDNGEKRLALDFVWFIICHYRTWTNKLHRLFWKWEAFTSNISRLLSWIRNSMVNWNSDFKKISEELLEVGTMDFIVVNKRTNLLGTKLIGYAKTWRIYKHLNCNRTYCWIDLVRTNVWSDWNWKRNEWTCSNSSFITIPIDCFCCHCFFIFGLYGLSADGKFKKLPFLKLGIFGIAGIYIFRGLGELIVDTLQGTNSSTEIIYSIFALAIGLLFLIGGLKKWKLKKE